MTREAQINQVEREEFRDRAGAIEALLPAWFTAAMMVDGRYGLLMSSGATLAIRRISRVTRDAAPRLWLDVELFPHGNTRVVGQPPSIGTVASVNAAHVAAAFEVGGS